MSEAGRRYTEEELRIAKSVDLTAVAQRWYGSDLCTP